jgi:two-component system chemotaxis response regulator CheB
MIRILLASNVRPNCDLLARMLEPDAHISVVGEASDGEAVVSMTRRLRPSLILMDGTLLRHDGVEATRRIMMEIPTAIVIASDPQDAARHEAESNALKAGALTVVPGPHGRKGTDLAEASREMISTVKAMAPIKLVRRWPERPAWDATSPRRLVGASRQAGATVWPRLVAIAASTGGPGALQVILRALPRDFPLPILLVQHIAGGFTGSLVKWLDSGCTLRVKIAEEGEPILAGTVYVAPDRRHLGCNPALQVSLSDAAPIGGFCPSASHLFEQVAASVGAASVCIMLTGMGDDGVAGLVAVHKAGGVIVAQDEASSVVFGMPGNAIAAGLVDAVLPLSDICADLIRRATPPRK